MTAADQGHDARAPLVYSVDRSWDARIARLDVVDGAPYDKVRKMHRTWPMSEDRYGTAACRSSIILNIEDGWRADDRHLLPEDLCRRCIPAPVATRAAIFFLRPTPPPVEETP